MKVTSNRWQRRRLVRILLAAAVACGVLAALAPAGARANYNVRECNSRTGNVDAAMIRPFGGATKISQMDTCGGAGWGLRMEANGQSTNNTYVVWQWTAPPNTIFKTAQTSLHYYTHGGYGPMTSGSGSPGYSAVGGGGDQWVTPVQSNTGFYALYEQCFASPCSSTVCVRVHHGLLCRGAGSSVPISWGFGRVVGWRCDQRHSDDQGDGCRFRGRGAIRSRLRQRDPLEGGRLLCSANRRVRVTQAMSGCFWPERSATRYRARSRMGQRRQRCTDLRV